MSTRTHVHVSMSTSACPRDHTGTCNLVTPGDEGTCTPRHARRSCVTRNCALTSRLLPYPSTLVERQSGHSLHASRHATRRARPCTNSYAHTGGLGNERGSCAGVESGDSGRRSGAMDGAPDARRRFRRRRKPDFFRLSDETTLLHPVCRSKVHAWPLRTVNLWHWAPAAQQMKAALPPSDWVQLLFRTRGDEF